MRQGCPLATLPVRALPSKAANKAVNRTLLAPVIFSVSVSKASASASGRVQSFKLR